jgi:hypothetical protein
VRERMGGKDGVWERDAVALAEALLGYLCDKTEAVGRHGPPVGGGEDGEVREREGRRMRCRTSQS